MFGSCLVRVRVRVRVRVLLVSGFVSDSYLVRVSFVSVSFGSCPVRVWFRSGSGLELYLIRIRSYLKGFGFVSVYNYIFLIRIMKINIISLSFLLVLF